MGTRADFYIRKDKLMEWLASKSFDGYPEGIDEKVLKSETEDDYRNNLTAFLKECDDVSYPEDGWPWPWDDSRTTDYSYIFEDGKVLASNFGYNLFDPLATSDIDPDDDDDTKMKDYFPDMKDVQNVAFGKRSGMTIIRRSADGNINVI